MTRIAASYCLKRFSGNYHINTNVEKLKTSGQPISFLTIITDVDNWNYTSSNTSDPRHIWVTFHRSITGVAATSFHKFQGKFVTNPNIHHHPAGLKVYANFCSFSPKFMFHSIMCHNATIPLPMNKSVILQYPSTVTTHPSKHPDWPIMS